MTSKITIDCRESKLYQQSHINLSYNIPFDTLPSRSYELPPRTTHFNVVTTESHLQIVNQWFLLSHKTPWPVASFIIYEQDQIVRTISSNPTKNPSSNEQIETSIVYNVSKHLSSQGVPIFPFSPAPLLNQELLYLQRVLQIQRSSTKSESELTTPFSSSSLTSSTPLHLIVDVGCGAGRDVLTLSYAFPKHTIVAIDSLSIAISRVDQFVQREERTNVQSILTKLNHQGDLEKSIFEMVTTRSNSKIKTSATPTAKKTQTAEAMKATIPSSTIPTVTIPTATLPTATLPTATLPTATVPTTTIPTSKSGKKLSAKEERKQKYLLKKKKNQHQNQKNRKEPYTRSEIVAKTNGTCSIIIISRFINRNLWNDYYNLLEPGGYLLIHHFLMSCSKPKAAIHKLHRDELTNLYQNKLEIIKDDVHMDGDRELSMWVGRKPEDGRVIRNDKRRKKKEK